MKFVVQEVSVKVSADGTTKMQGTIMARGHSVHLEVTSDQQPIKDVIFFVYPLDQQRRLLGSELPADCLTEKVSGFSNPRTTEAPLCHISSDRNGRVALGPLPGGRYTLVPYYRGESDLVFDVQPDTLTVTVSHADVRLGPNTFRVAGYAVSGRVLLSKDGPGVASARVALEEQPEVLTDAEGRFTLEGTRSGSYVLRVRAEALEFEPVRIQVSPSAPRLPDVLAARFAVCGHVLVDKLASGGVAPTADAESRQVVVEAAATKQQLMTVQTHGTAGAFCAFLPAGSYVLRPLVSAEEDDQGLRLAPVQHEVVVASAPVSNLRFSQFRALVSGSVDCLEACPPLRLTLTPSVGSGAGKTLELGQPAAPSLAWQFADVTPGRYRLRLEELAEERRACWLETELALEVADKDVVAVQLRQSGYRLAVVASHVAQLNFKLEGATDVAGVQELRPGGQSLCLPRPGNYSLSGSSCHRLERAVWRHDTAALPAAPLTVTVAAHQVTIAVELDAPVADVRLQLEFEGAAHANRVLGPLAFAPGQLRSQLAVWEPAGTVLRVTALSAHALFEPASALLTVAGVECNPTAAVLRGQLGAFVVGRVVPHLAGVALTLTGAALDAPLHASSDAAGEYRFGPLPPLDRYAVAADKLGYKFTAAPAAVNESTLERRRDFSAHKLAEVLVAVADGSGRPLAGVLLSVSGDDYRGTELTDAEGRFRFLGLSPGVYYVRAAMKEFVFEMGGGGEVRVEEGRAVTLTVAGQRVSFTASGVVQSLSGEPEPHLALEALADADGSCAAAHVETGAADAAGRFRLRGLRPGCRYTIQLRADAPANAAIERTAPARLQILMPAGDLPALHLYAFRRLPLLHLSASVQATLKEHVASLRLQVFPENAPHRVLLTHQLAKSPLLYTTALPADGKRYVMRLESGLPSALWSGAGPQEMSFRAIGVEQSGALHLRMKFAPQRRTAEPDMAASSFLALPLTMLLMLAFYYRRNLEPYSDPLFTYLRVSILDRLLGVSSGGSVSAGSGSGASGGSPRHQHAHLSDPNDLSDISPDLLRPMAAGGGGGINSGGMVHFGFRGGKAAKAKARKA